MKFFVLISVAGFLCNSASGGPSERTVNILTHEIRESIPKGWTVSYDKPNSLVRVTRDEPVLIATGGFNTDGRDVPVKDQYEFWLSVSARMPSEEYRRLKIEDAETKKEMSALYDDLRHRGVQGMGDEFNPENASDKVLVKRYDALKASLHDLPEFYFQDLDIRTEPWWNSESIVDDKIRDESKRIKEQVLKLLSCYDPAIFQLLDMP